MAKEKKHILEDTLKTAGQDFTDGVAMRAIEKFKTLIYVFYLVSMLFAVILSLVILNDIGKISNTLLVISACFFGTAFLTLIGISVWKSLNEKSNMKATTERLRRTNNCMWGLKGFLSLVTYAFSIITLVNTWEMGIGYKLFYFIILIAVAVTSVWMVVSDIFEAKAKKERERIEAEEAKAREEASLKFKVSQNAEKVGSQTKKTLSKNAVKLAIGAKIFAKKAGELTKNTKDAIIAKKQSLNKNNGDDVIVCDITDGEDIENINIQAEEEQYDITITKAKNIK